MDKSWIRMPRNTPEYVIGLNQFLNFAFNNAAIGDKIKFPCPKCSSRKWQTRKIVFNHLIDKPFPKNYVVGKVLGEKHSGRVRCLGLGPVPSKVFKQARPRFGGTSASSSEGSCSSRCQQNHKQMMNAQEKMMNAFKAYMIMKEGTILEQFAGFFASSSAVSPTTTSDAASGSVSPMDARRTCGDSNPSDNR